MQLSCGGGLSWVLMGECDHFFIGNHLLLLRESPLVVDEQFKITKSWGTAIESWKEIEISIFHFHRPLFLSWEIRLQNPHVWSTKKKCFSVTAFWDFHFSPENFFYAGSVNRHSCKTTKLAKSKKVQTTIYSKDRSNLGWISVLPENVFSLRTENCRRHFAIHLQVSCELVSTSLDMQIQIQKYKYSNINRQIQIDP